VGNDLLRREKNPPPGCGLLQSGGESYGFYIAIAGICPKLDLTGAIDAAHQKGHADSKRATA
jgi:hypothetical protein